MEALLILLVIGTVIVVLACAKPSKCDVCGLPIKRTSHMWTIQGEKKRLCPKCNSQMERKVSKAAFKSKYG